MPLIPSYLEFEGLISLPNTLPTKASGELLGLLSTSCTDEILTDVLGYELYQLLVTNEAQGSGIYHDLINGVEFTDSFGRLNKWMGFTRGYNPIANYTYFRYIQQTATVTTGLGEKGTNSENMIAASAVTKANRAWNKMADWLTVLHDYLIINKADYPTYIGINYSPYDKGNANSKYFQKLTFL